MNQQKVVKYRSLCVAHPAQTQYLPTAMTDNRYVGTPLEMDAQSLSVRNPTFFLPCPKISNFLLP